MRFSTKISALFSAIVFIAGLIITYSAYTSSIHILKEEIAARLEDSAFHTMDKIDRLLFERLADLKTMANDPVITSKNSTPARITEKLIVFRNKYKHYVSLTFFDMDRKVIADSSGMNIGRRHSYSEYWPGIAEGKDFVMIISDSELIGDRVIYFAAPVREQSGKAIGVVVSRMLIEKLYNIVNKAAGIRSAQEYIEIDLVDGKGLLLYSNYNQGGILKEILNDWDSVQKRLNEGSLSGDLIHRHPTEKEEELLAFVKEQGYMDFKGEGWTLIEAMPTKVVFAPAIELRNRMIVMLSVTAVLTFIIINILSRIITKPLSELSAAAVEIGKGNLETRVGIQSGDEVGQLSMSFNKMAFELKESQEKLLAYSRELESKVEERTMALTKANEQMQDELKERLRIERELGELFEYNRKLFEVAYIGIWIIDLVPLTEEDKLTDPNYFWHRQIGVKIITRNLNERMYGMLGLVREEMLGRSIFDPLFVDDTNAQIYMKEIIARREGKKGSYELTLRHKDGHAVPVLINAIPLVTDTKTGKTIQSVGVFTELSDIKKMEEELLKAKKLESIGILAGGIAHDFNNLLTVILGNIEISRMFSKPGDKIFERLLDAEDACRKAGELSNRLITLSIGGEPFKEIASIAEIIREAASSSEVSCQIDLPDDLYHAAVDGRQIKQALGNILVNAKEAMPEGGIVKIRGENIAITEKDHFPLKDGAFIKISIEDRGTGISEENLSKIFDPYFTTKGMGSEKGKGLGLTVSYSIIKKHDGLISFESKVGEGTTFHIYLPATDSN